MRTSNIPEMSQSLGDIYCRLRVLETLLSSQEAVNQMDTNATDGALSLLADALEALNTIIEDMSELKEKTCKIEQLQKVQHATIQSLSWQN